MSPPAATSPSLLDSLQPLLLWARATLKRMDEEGEEPAPDRQVVLEQRGAGRVTVGELRAFVGAAERVGGPLP